MVSETEKLQDYAVSKSETELFQDCQSVSQKLNQRQSSRIAKSETLQDFS